MNLVKHLALKFLLPDLYHERVESAMHIDYLEKTLATTVADGLQYRGILQGVAQERDDCLNNLVALVAMDDDGHWTTVFDADTRLPAEISDYLTGLVGRA